MRYAFGDGKWSTLGVKTINAVNRTRALMKLRWKARCSSDEVKEKAISILRKSIFSSATDHHDLLAPTL